MDASPVRGPKPSPEGLTGHEPRYVRVIERRDAQDFPYYSGQPVHLSGRQWCFLMATVALAFGVLTFAPLADLLWGFPLAILYAGLPLLGLAIVAREHWTAIFRPLSAVDFLLMVGFAILNVVITFGVGFVVSVTVGGNANPSASTLAEASTLERFLFYPRAAIQLLGEELFTILPFLALLTLGMSKLKLTRTQAVIAAWLVSALIFGLIHLPTYQWNVVQCVAIIGSARLILSLAYTRTRNLWVSTGAHVVNDWMLFSLPLLIDSLR